MKVKFDVYDYLIFFFVIFVSIFIGLYFGLDLKLKTKSLFKRLFKSKTSPCNEKLELQSVNETSADQIKNDKTMNFLTANSSLGAIPLSLSLLATFFSSCKFKNKKIVSKCKIIRVGIFVDFLKSTKKIL